MSSYEWGHFNELEYFKYLQNYGKNGSTIEILFQVLVIIFNMFLLSLLS